MEKKDKGNKPTPVGMRSSSLGFTPLSTMYSYQAYGLEIISDFSLPELPALNFQKAKNPLRIVSRKLNLPPLENARIPRQGLEAWFGGSPQEAYLRWPGVASFKAVQGNLLFVDPDWADISDEILNLYILSEALGLILFQRGLFLLHASAVYLEERIVVFIGMPGAGKSTTAAAFSQKGYPVLSDDMVAITFDSCNQPIVVPGFPQIKIWPSSVEGLGLSDNNLPSLYEGSRKQVIRQFDNFPLVPIPLAHIFFLEQGETVAVEPFSAASALMALTRFFPCPAGLLQGDSLATHFEQCDRLLKTIPISKLVRSSCFANLDKIIQLVEGTVAAPCY